MHMRVKEELVKSVFRGKELLKNKEADEKAEHVRKCEDSVVMVRSMS